ncbi:MAG: hypothetical protein ABIN01_22200 [Ferruginibacter sp.]
MKKQSTTLFSQISTQHFDNLTTVVNETLSAGFKQSATKIFTVAELWDIQRRGKSQIQRRFFY